MKRRLYTSECGDRQPPVGQRRATKILRPHPLVAELYGEFCGENDALLESVKTTGVLTPLIITPDGLVVAGCERLRVADKLGLADVPVIVLCPLSIDAAHRKAAAFGWLENQTGSRKAERPGAPERRLAGLYKQATTAVTKVVNILKGEDASNFTPEQNRQLREALTPVLKWVDGLDRA